MCHQVKESCQFPFISSGLQHYSPLSYMSLIAFYLAILSSVWNSVKKVVGPHAKNLKS